MSEKVLCEKSDLVAIADAVREATGSAENYNVSELSAATVEAISAGGGGTSVETCTVSFSGFIPTWVSYTGYLSGNIEACFVEMEGTIDIVKNTAIVFYSPIEPLMLSINGGEIVDKNHGTVVILCRGNAVLIRYSSEPS